jgi:hypothetical protein
MSRSRVSYQSESLFVCRDSHISHFRDGAVFAEEDEGGDLFPITFDGEEYNSRRNLPFNHPNGNLVEQLQRIQSINFDIHIPKINVHQFGTLGRIDSLLVESPIVDFKFSYLLSDAYNEKLLNFNIGTHPEDFLEDEYLYRDHNTFHHYISNPNGLNFFIETGKDGVDLLNSDELNADRSTVAVGTSFLNNYSVEASVGSLPTASLDFTALNINAHKGIENLPVPTILPQGGKTNFKFSLPDYQLHHLVEEDLLNDELDQGISTIRPGDIVLALNGEEHNLFAKQNSEIDGWTDGACNIQSFQIECRFTRTPISRLGKIWANAYSLDKAPEVVLRITALVSDLKESGLGDKLCASGADASIYLFDPCADRSLPHRDTTSMIYTFRDLQIESEQFSSAIGDNKMVDIILSTSCEAKDKNRSGFYIWGRAFEGQLLVDQHGNPIITDINNPLSLFGVYNRGI